MEEMVCVGGHDGGWSWRRRLQVKLCLHARGRDGRSSGGEVKLAAVCSLSVSIWFCRCVQTLMIYVAASEPCGGPCGRVST
jgi:hypothetical protein